MASDWGGSCLSEEAKMQILSLASALDSLNEDGTPNFRQIQKMGGPAFERQAVVNSMKDITEHGRDDEWLLSAIFDKETLENAGEVAEEALDYLRRILFGAYNPLNPTGVGQTYAKSKGYILCEYRRKGEKTLRFFTQNKDVAAKTYVEDTSEGVRKALVKAHKQVSLALDVIPELEDEVAKKMLTKIKAGLSELPEAKAEVRAITNGKGTA